MRTFNLTYGELELIVKVEYVDDSFEHAFGTHHQGHFEILEIKYNDAVIPLALVSEETLEILEEKINK